MTIVQFRSKFPDEKAAIDYFVNVRYGGVLVCPHCGAGNGVYRYRLVKKLCHCKNCNNSFSPFRGTIFEKSSTELWKWFFAVHLFLNDRKGCSACFIKRELGVTYKTAWRMLRQIRTAMGNGELKPFESLVEVDETYVGGKPRRYPSPKGVDLSLLAPAGEPPKTTAPAAPPPATTGRGTKKTPVFGIKERESGKVYAQVMLPDGLGRKLTGANC